MLLEHHARSFARIVLGLTLTAAIALGLIATTAFAGTQDLVISQVYGGGGNAGATYTNDFIEIHNRGTATLSLAGMSVQYASALSSSWAVTALSGSIAPGAYYLVQEAVGTGGTTPLPTPDATGTIAMAATAGKVALVNSTTALAVANPVGAVDLFGYGTATGFEGTVFPALTNTTAASRLNSGCQDNDVNSTDFASGAAAPRNSSSSLFNCRFTVTLAAGSGGSISPSTTQTVIRGDNLPFTVTASTGYHIASVLDGVSELGTGGSYSLLNVTADHSISATFAINTYTLTYTAGAGGSIVGTASQTVNHGANGSAGHGDARSRLHFVGWSDGFPTAARTDRTSRPTSAPRRASRSTPTR